MKSDVKVTGNTLQITRVFDAPCSIVFGYWSEADKLQQWSGCKDAIKCEIEMDFRVGGSFTQKMHIAGAGEFTVTGTYDEITVPDRIGYQADLGGTITRILIEFFDERNRTKVVLTQRGFPDETLCKIVSHGTEESLDRLDSLLAGQVVNNRP
jgi:uncharacterized protein YndB with AHSA1/START domain